MNQTKRRLAHHDITINIDKLFHLSNISKPSSKVPDLLPFISVQIKPKNIG